MKGQEDNILNLMDTDCYISSYYRHGSCDSHTWLGTEQNIILTFCHVLWQHGYGKHALKLTL